jgi:hypothetical protein
MRLEPFRLAGNVRLEPDVIGVDRAPTAVNHDPVIAAAMRISGTAADGAFRRLDGPRTEKRP